LLSAVNTEGFKLLLDCSPLLWSVNKVVDSRSVRAKDRYIDFDVTVLLLDSRVFKQVFFKAGILIIYIILSVLLYILYDPLLIPRTSDIAI
jgi:hypothetical protein